MTPEQLKYSILKKAFSGQLVPNVTNQPLPQVKSISLEEPPMDIPDDWFWSTLGNCCEMYTGNSISENVKKTKYTGLSEGYDYIATKDVSFEHSIEYNNGVKIPADDDFRIAYKGSVLMCIEGGSAGRKIGILDRDVCFGNKLCSFNSKEILNTYIYYYLQSHEFKSYFMGNMSGIIGGVSIKKLKELPIPIPSINEQHSIIEKIEQLLPFIARYAESYDKLNGLNENFPEEMKKSILQYAVQGKLVEQRPEEDSADDLYTQIQKDRSAKGIKKNKKLLELTEDEFLFDIPDSWKWVRIGEIFQTSSGTTPSKSNHEYYNSPDFNWIRTTDLNNSTLYQGEVKISKKAKDECNLDIIPMDSVCLAMYGGGGTIGKNALIQFETTINQSVCAIHPNGYCNMKYLLYYMQYFRPFWMMYAAGSRKDPNINQIVINNAVFPLPPQNEQNRIVEKIENLLTLCDRLQKGESN